MGSSKVTSVLKAWYIVESLAPSEVPYKDETVEGTYFEDNQKRKRTRLIQINEYPWEFDVLKDKEKYQINYRYYLGCFEQYELVQLVRDKFNAKEEIINQSKTTLFSFTFEVDDKGQYVKESIFVPFLMYVLKGMNQKADTKYSDLMNQFQKQSKLFEERTQTSFVNGVTEEALQEVQKAYQQYFYQFGTDTISYLETEVKKIGEQSSSTNFNSFYLDDLAQIISKGENETLRDFIEGVDKNERINLSEAPERIEEILQPKNMPNGRWPSPVEHRLSLMQQVAVNLFLNDDRKISSVNGSPGTGKTTLLKDIFADLVVQRAVKLAKFNEPTKVFHKMAVLELDSYHYPIYQLDLNVSKFSMVVASSNNGAVENISKELPQLKEVTRPSKEIEKSEFKPYEESYAEEAEKLSMYPSVAESLLGDDSKGWGLFSAALGKSKNISDVGWALQGKNGDETSFLAQLEKDSKQVTLKDWKEAVKEFQEAYELIQVKKSQLQDFADTFREMRKVGSQLAVNEKLILKLEDDQKEAESTIEHIDKQKKLTEQQLQNLPKQSIFQRLLNKKDEQKVTLQKEMNDLLSGLKNEENKLYQTKKTKKEEEKKNEGIRKSVAAFKKQEEDYKNQNLILPEENYWSDSQEAYEYRQIKTIWLTDELNYERGLIFLKAMKLHKLLLMSNFGAIKSTIRLLNNHKKLNLNDSKHKSYLKNMWQTIHLITPVVSTTFASFSTMYRGIEKDFIDYLFIDEAGQASPQLAAGALWRSKRAIAVGDPLQIEPVVTIDNTILEDIRNHTMLSEHYINADASVQTLSDRANPYGMLTENNLWIGTPLWVHRRCLNPMFVISNEIAYENKMVLAKKETGKSAWFDRKGKATNRQYVKEQGEFVAEQIVELWKKSQGLPNAYIISPFTAVKEGVKKAVTSKLKEVGIPKDEIKNWINKSIGTVHTFQGKEADIVYFITGTDEESDGAANWSCSKPNILNVVVTRAKKEFYVIGDYERFKNKQYYSSIIKHIDRAKDVQ